MATTTGARSRKRTANQAIQSDRLQQQIDQQKANQTTKQALNQVQSVKGATHQAINLIRSQNLGGLRGTPEGNQLAKEYAGRAHSLKANLPFAVAPIQQQMKSDLAGISTDLLKDRLGLQQDQQDKAQAIADILQTRSQNQAQKATDVQSAVNQALRIIKEQQLTNADPNADPKHKGPAVPQTELEWMQFEDHLAGQSGIDNRAARKAVKKLQRELLRSSYGRHTGPTSEASVLLGG